MGVSDLCLYFVKSRMELFFCINDQFPQYDDYVVWTLGSYPLCLHFLRKTDFKLLQ